MRYSVLTPTFNRARLLPDAFRSLVEQTDRDLEWIVVDDGSTDDTPDTVRALASEAPFPVCLLSQPNRGKHVAVNRAIGAAQGEFAAILDSDDVLLPDALDRLYRRWLEIPSGERDGYVGVTGLCLDENGHVHGRRFPRDPLDVTYQECRYRHKITCEKWGVQRLEVLRQYPFPETAGRTCVPESVVWRQIGLRWRTRYVNEPVRVYRQQPAHLTDQLSAMSLTDRAAGAVLAYSAALNHDLRWLLRAPTLVGRFGIQLVRFGRHGAIPLSEQAAMLQSPAAKAMWALAIPAGNLAYLRDRHQIRRGAGRNASTIGRRRAGPPGEAT
jgi:glycosyltransferase involved in cell wall biosynthesis